MDPASAVQGLGLVVSTANGIRALVSGWRKGEKPPEEDVRLAEQGLADLVGKLGALTIEFVGLQAENIELRAKVSELKKVADLDSKRVTRNGAYYLPDPPPGYSKGPYCAACWAEGKHMPLMNKRYSESGKLCPDEFLCTRCKGSQFIPQG